MGILPTATEGLSRTGERIQRVAERLARLPSQDSGSAPEDTVDLSTEVLALLAAKNEHAVNVKLAETAAEVEQQILDILG